jgi:hypothetical protein
LLEVDKFRQIGEAAGLAGENGLVDGVWRPVGKRDAELLFDFHEHLNHVQAVPTEVIDQPATRRNPVPRYPEILGGNITDSPFNLDKS